jgi:hypothetical protein
MPKQQKRKKGRKKKGFVVGVKCNEPWQQKQRQQHQ